MESRHRVTAGETLYDIARAVYGDPALFGILAEANDIAEPYEIDVGDVIIIPPLTVPPVDAFLKHVYQKQLTDRGNVGGNLVTVPRDKMLVIEDVVVQMSITPNHRMLFMIQGSKAEGGAEVRGPCYWVPFVQRHSGGASDLLVGGRTTRWYVEGGSRVSYYAEGANPTDGFLTLAVSGHFLDYQTVG